MAETFQAAFEHTVGYEGGYTNDPQDTGNWTGGKVNAGELKGTRFGISAAAYPAEDIIHLTADRAKVLYKRDYWDALDLDQIDFAPLAIDLFDAAVNTGKGRAVKLFQKALNLTNRNQQDYANIAVDGGMGNETMTAYHQNTNKRILCNVFNIQRGAFYCSLMDQNEQYERYIGWFERIEIIKKSE